MPKGIEPSESKIAPPPPATIPRLSGLEGPRGLACLCVIMVHCAVHYAPDVLAATRIDYLGQALTFFFVLSGFLLYLPYVERLRDGRPKPATGKYLKRRVLRVFPAYLVIFIIANYALRAVYVESPVHATWDEIQRGTGMITDPWQLLANLTLTQSLFPATLQTGINPSWSLTTEFGFYLTLPIIAGLLFKFCKSSRHRMRIALVPPAILIVVGVATNVIVGMLQHRQGLTVLEAYWGDHWVAVLSRSYLAFADTFAFGMIAAVLYAMLSRGALARVSTRRLQWLFAGLMVSALAVSLVLFVLNPRNMSTAVAMGSSMFILTIIAPLARGENSTLARIADWRPIRTVGVVSLSAYLWHYPVLIMFDRLGVPIPTGWLGLMIGFIASTAVTMALALVSFRFVEAPAMRFRG